MGTLSIKTRITLAAGSCLFVMVLCLVGFSIHQMRDTSAVVSESSPAKWIGPQATAR
jgi:methyl-accepting chemotaxis protein